jgi:hypothetical protein
MRASAIMTGMRLLPATIQHLVALQSDRKAFGRLIGSPVPEGWPEEGPIWRWELPVTAC